MDLHSTCMDNNGHRRNDSTSSDHSNNESSNLNPSGTTPTPPSPAMGNVQSGGDRPPGDGGGDGNQAPSRGVNTAMFSKNLSHADILNMRKMENAPSENKSELYKYLVEQKRFKDVGVPVSAPANAGSTAKITNTAPAQATPGGQSASQTTVASSTSAQPASWNSSLVTNGTCSRTTSGRATPVSPHISVSQRASPTLPTGTEQQNSDSRPTEAPSTDAGGGSRVNSPCSSDSSGSVHHLGPKKKFLQALHHSSSDSNLEQSGVASEHQNSHSNPSPPSQPAAPPAANSRTAAESKQFTHASQFVAEALAGHLLNPGKPASLHRSEDVKVKMEPPSNAVPTRMFDLRTCIDGIIDSPSIRNHLMNENDNDKENGNILDKLRDSEEKDVKFPPGNKSSFPAYNTTPTEHVINNTQPNHSKATQDIKPTVMERTAAEKRTAIELSQQPTKKLAGESPHLKEELIGYSRSSAVSGHRPSGSHGQTVDRDARTGYPAHHRELPRAPHHTAVPHHPEGYAVHGPRGPYSGSTIPRPGAASRQSVNPNVPQSYPQHSPVSKSAYELHQQAGHPIHAAAQPRQHISGHAGAHSATHPVPHTASHPGVHSAPHPASHSVPRPALHSAPNQGAHSVPHPGSNSAAHPTAHTATPSGAHPPTHSATHAGPYVATHQGAHLVTHSGTHSATHPGTHPPTHPGTHPTAHPGVHVATHQGAHSVTHQGHRSHHQSATHQSVTHQRVPSPQRSAQHPAGIPPSETQYYSRGGSHEREISIQRSQQYQQQIHQGKVHQSYERTADGRYIASQHSQHSPAVPSSHLAAGQGATTQASDSQGGAMMPPQSPHHRASPREVARDVHPQGYTAITNLSRPHQRDAHPPKHPSAHPPQQQQQQQPVPARSPQNAASRTESRASSSDSGEIPLDLTKPKRTGSQPLDLTVPKSSPVPVREVRKVALPPRIPTSATYPNSGVVQTVHPVEHAGNTNVRPPISMPVMAHHNRNQEQPATMYRTTEDALHESYKRRTEHRTELRADHRADHRALSPRQHSEQYYTTRYAPSKPSGGSITTGRPITSVAAEYPPRHIDNRHAVSPHIVNQQSTNQGSSHQADMYPQDLPKNADHQVPGQQVPGQQVSGQQSPHMPQNYSTSQTPHHKVPFAYTPMRGNHPPSKPPLVGRAEPYFISGKVAPMRAVPATEQKSVSQPVSQPVTQPATQPVTQSIVENSPVQLSTAGGQPHGVGTPTPKQGSGRTSSTALLLGNHPIDDILYLKCNVCSLTYGSLHSIKKHFFKAHGFQPGPENLTIRSIKGHKENSVSSAAPTNPSIVFTNSSNSNSTASSTSTTPKNSPMGEIAYVVPTQEPNDKNEIKSKPDTTPDVEHVVPQTYTGRSDSAGPQGASVEQASPGHQQDSSLPEASPGVSTTPATVPPQPSNPQNPPAKKQSDDSENSVPVKSEIVSPGDDIESKVESEQKSASSVMKCHDCGEAFPTRDWGVFKRHMRAHDQPHTRCQICRQTFGDRAELEEHNIAYHNGSNGTPSKSAAPNANMCIICEIGFAHAGALTKHLKDRHHGMHITEKELRCLYCNGEFINHKDLMLHVRTCVHQQSSAQKPASQNTSHEGAQTACTPPTAPTNDTEQGEVDDKPTSKGAITESISTPDPSSPDGMSEDNIPAPENVDTSATQNEKESDQQSTNCRLQDDDDGPLTIVTTPVDECSPASIENCNQHNSTDSGHLNETDDGKSVESSTPRKRKLENHDDNTQEYGDTNERDTECQSHGEPPGDGRKTPESAKKQKVETADGAPGSVEATPSKQPTITITTIQPAKGMHSFATSFQMMQRQMQQPQVKPKHNKPAGNSNDSNSVGNFKTAPKDMSSSSLVTVSLTGTVLSPSIAKNTRSALTNNNSVTLKGSPSEAGTTNRTASNEMSASEKNMKLRRRRK